MTQKKTYKTCHYYVRIESDPITVNTCKLAGILPLQSPIQHEPANTRSLGNIEAKNQNGLTSQFDFMDRNSEIALRITTDF